MFSALRQLAVGVTFLTLVCIGGAGRDASGGEPKKFDNKAIAKIGRAATAYIEVDLPGNKVGSGSGFCVHPSGLFVTNAHVIKSASGPIRLVLHPGADGQKKFTAKVLRVDDGEDLAILQADLKEEFATLSMGTNDHVSELLSVLAFGFPFGKRLASTDEEYAAITMNTLSISSLRNKANSLYRIQLDGALNPGNSGGPVVDSNGKVLGVVVSGIRGSGLAEAIPVGTVRKFLSTPSVDVTYPTVSSTNRGAPCTFSANVVSVMPSGKVELNLAVEAGAHKVSAPMTAKGAKYSAEVVAIPASTDKWFPATVTVDGATLQVQIEDRKFKVGDKVIDLSKVSKIEMNARGHVSLFDGQKFLGPIADLGKATTKVAGADLAIDLERASVIVLPPRPAPKSVKCTIVVLVEGLEVARLERTLGVDAPPQVASLPLNRPNPAAVEIPEPAPPKLPANRKDVQLPATTDAFCAGGNGRYIVLRLPTQRSLAIFDTTLAKLVKFVPLSEPNAAFAAGLEKFFIAYPEANVIERWDFETFKKEASEPLAEVKENDKVKHLLMGSASRGPVVVVKGASFFLDAESMKPIEYRFADANRLDLQMPQSRHSRISADGTAITYWNAPSPATLLLSDDTATRFGNDPSWAHAAPSADGRIIYTAKGARSPQGVRVGSEPVPVAPNAPPNEYFYLVPALQGRFCICLPFSGHGESRNGATLHLNGERKRIGKLKDVDIDFEVNQWDRELVGADQRVMLIPSAKLLVVVPNASDRLCLYKLDIDEILESSGADYLMVTSSPGATVAKGATYTYDVAVKSKKGSVTYKLESGPDGMSIDAAGKLTWPVPPAFAAKTVDVLLTISDASKEDVFHSFKIAVTP